MKASFNDINQLETGAFHRSNLHSRSESSLMNCETVSELNVLINIDGCQTAAYCQGANPFTTIKIFSRQVRVWPSSFWEATKYQTTDQMFKRLVKSAVSCIKSAFSCKWFSEMSKLFPVSQASSSHRWMMHPDANRQLLLRFSFMEGLNSPNSKCYIH